MPTQHHERGVVVEEEEEERQKVEDSAARAEARQMDRLRGEGKIPRGYQCQQEDAVAQLQTQVKSQRSVAQSGQATGQVRSGQVRSGQLESVYILITANALHVCLHRCCQ